MSASQPSWDLVPLMFEGQDVSYVLMDGEPWWPAGGPCEVLGYDLKHVDAILRRHTDVDERQKLSLPRSGGGIREQWCINEFGLYGLIMGSQKPEAKRFQRWIKHEVLPSIRKSGQYRLAPERVLENIKRPVQIQHTKDVAKFLYLEGKQAIIRWMVDSFVGIKGMPPKTYVKNAYFQGDITNKNLSGREALRRREPPKACVISLMDQLRFEFTADDITAIEVAKQFEPGFQAILNAGLKAPAELGPSPLEQQTSAKSVPKKRDK